MTNNKIPVTDVEQAKKINDLYRVVTSFFCGTYDEEEPVDAAIELFSQIEYHVPYEVIFKVILDVPKLDIKKIKGRINGLKKDQDEPYNKILDDIRRNIILSIEQKNYIDNQVVEAKNKLNIMEGQLREVNDIKSKIYTDFITILGIFTAITFAAFGGIQLLGNLFNNITGKNINQLPFLGDMLILSSIFGLIMYGLIVTLFVGINKTTSVGRKYSFTPSIKNSIIVVLSILFLLGVFCLILSYFFINF